MNHYHLLKNPFSVPLWPALPSNHFRNENAGLCLCGEKGFCHQLTTLSLLHWAGGPERPEDVVPFLEGVTAGRNIPPERLKLVAKQYEKIGGISPYNRLTREQAEALQKLLKSRGLDIPVVLGFAHYAPRIADTLPNWPNKIKQKVLRHRHGPPPEPRFL